MDKDHIELLFHSSPRGSGETESREQWNVVIWRFNGPPTSVNCKSGRPLNTLAWTFMGAPKRSARELEFEPDAWARFERAVDVVAKSPPQHRVKAKRKRHKSPTHKTAYE
jgi:hypothetical protein